MRVVLPTADGTQGGLPRRVTSHVSGGRDLWSAPLEAAPDDPVATAWSVLGEVLDPELPVSLVELGLIYGVDVHDGVAEVRLTYTATACPCMEFIREDVTDRLEQEPWVREVRLVEVWDPPWTTDRITPDGRARLRRLGVGA
jgi:metal-sulfur cluster biosynthetic enzyme